MIISLIRIILGFDYRGICPFSNALKYQNSELIGVIMQKLLILTILTISLLGFGCVGGSDNKGLLEQEKVFSMTHSKDLSTMNSISRKESAIISKWKSLDSTIEDRVQAYHEYVVFAEEYAYSANTYERHATLYIAFLDKHEDSGVFDKSTTLRIKITLGDNIQLFNRGKKGVARNLETFYNYLEQQQAVDEQRKEIFKKLLGLLIGI